jgi:Uncharacterized membrane protein (homolog of Drosophila rhomboid)
VLVFFVTMAFPQLKGYLGLSVEGCIVYHFWWQPVTYLFVHSNVEHILFNMIGLFCFGIMVERAIGSKEFLLLYFFCGILDGLISLLLYYFMGTNVLLIGASGAIYSILLVYAVLFPRSVISIWGIIPVPAPLLVIIYAVIEIGSQFIGASNVAHLTHLTGFVLAWLYLVVRMGLHPIKIWKDAYRR